MATAASATARAGRIVPSPAEPRDGLEPMLTAAFDALTVGTLICTPVEDHPNAELRRTLRLGADTPFDRSTFERSLRPLPGRAGRTTDGPSKPALRPIHAALARRGTPPTRAGVVRADGTSAVIRLAARPLLVNGARGAVVTVVDETAVYEVERLRDAFLGIVGHELRSPISSVLSAADLLRRGLEPDVAAEVATDLGSEAQRLHELVEQLIGLADLERLGIQWADEPVHVPNVARRTIRRWQERRPRLTIELDAPPDAPPVAGEDGYVAQALDILLDNAAKFAGWARPIVVRVVAEGAEVRVHVLDEGPGIRGAGADSIFELFHRVGGRQPADDGPSGHGIGLFVARAIVGALGGRMWAENRSERGADVGFALPIATE